MIEARGATLLYLPPCSPDLNLIGLMVAKLKHLLRSAAARSIDHIWAVLDDCLRKFTSEEYRQYLRHCSHCNLV